MINYLYVFTFQCEKCKHVRNAKNKGEIYQIYKTTKVPELEQSPSFFFTTDGSKDNHTSIVSTRTQYDILYTILENKERYFYI